MCVCQSVCSCMLNREQTIWPAAADPGGFHNSRKEKLSSRGRVLPWNLWKSDPLLVFLPDSRPCGHSDPDRCHHGNKTEGNREWEEEEEEEEQDGLSAANMLAIQGAGVLLLLSCVRLMFLAPPLCAGEGSNCSCNATNSRCDDFGVCRCDPGWDGELCQRCVTMPGCVHGSCLQPWQCACQPGWGGRFCDKDLSVCSQQPCLNGATCLMEDSGDFRCLCPDGFHGPTCRKRKGPCLQRRSPCKNGGLCEDADGFAAELVCRCLAGFTGPRCETDIDDCLMVPCASGATCVDGVNRFSCLCPVGFSGRFCTVNMDDCASQPCRNGGRCLDRAGGFRCLCRPGFTGTTCETAPSPANASPPVWTTRARDTGHHDNRKVKVTVKEHGAGGLSDLQLVVVLVLTIVSVGVVALTAALVLHAPGQRRGHTPCWLSPSPRSRREPGDQPEHRISFLNAAEPEKKKLNIEVV